MSQFLFRRTYRIEFLSFLPAGCLWMSFKLMGNRVAGQPQSSTPSAPSLPFCPFFKVGGRLVVVGGGCQCQFAQSNCNFLLLQQKKRSSVMSMSWLSSTSPALWERIAGGCAVYATQGCRGGCEYVFLHIFCIHSPLSGITLRTHSLPPFRHSVSQSVIHSFISSPWVWFRSLVMLTSSICCQYSTSRPHLWWVFHIPPTSPCGLNDFASLSLFAFPYVIVWVRVHHFRYFPSTFHSSASCCWRSLLFFVAIFHSISFFLPFFRIFLSSNLNSYYLCFAYEKYSKAYAAGKTSRKSHLCVSRMLCNSIQRGP